jgi:hypothetical protein
MPSAAVHDAPVATLTNAAIAGTMLAEAVAFDRATHDVIGAQTRLLREMIERQDGSAIGRDHGLSRVRALADLPHAMPLADYELHRPYVERVAAGEPDVLGRDAVRCLEPTSGSVAGAKLIPSTRATRRAFARGVAPWLVDVWRTDPRSAMGPAYWSVSPALRRPERSAGGIKIGFDDDTEYLGSAGRWLARAVLAVPSAVRHLMDAEDFRYVTLLHLVRCGRLRLASVWNPSFLTILLDGLDRHGAGLVDDLRQGRCRPPSGEERPDLAAPAAPERAALVRAALDRPERAPQRLWPHLRLVSCWTDANAAPAARELAARLPQARLQGKGLIATEAFVSLPLQRAPHPVLAVRSHVFEFLESDGVTTRFAHELEPGGEYQVVVTTGALFRYRLGDVVRIEGHHRRAPMLRFLGRSAHVSDFVGEKLHERHVREALEETWLGLGLTPRFALLACDATAAPPAYRIYLEGVEEPRHADVVAALERRLHDNPHYAYARALEQLGPLTAVPVRGGARSFEDGMAARGIARGDVKPVALSPLGDWPERFARAGADAPRRGRG